MTQHDSGCNGCSEYREWTRRRFLGAAGAAIATAATGPAWLPKVVLAADESGRDTLVVLFLRGAMDGLTTVVPYGDPNLYSPNLRPTLAVPPPGGLNGAIDLDGFFGLAPAMAPIRPAFDSGQLAIVHATGSPDPTRSHFDAFSRMEYGIPLQPMNTYTGWLARHLTGMPPIGEGYMRAVAIDDLVPKTLAGAPATIPVPDPADFAFPGSPNTASARRAALEAAYATAGEPLAGAAQSTVATIDLLNAIDFEGYVPASGAVYPQSSLGVALRAIAAMIKADIGLEAATTDVAGWDTHNQQGVFEGDMAFLMDNLSRSLAAFHLDTQSHMDRVTLLVMSEFGRRADENGSAGTDHGHGNCMIVMGGHIAGGQVLADWTANELLHPDLLYEGDSLDVTIDYRDIVAEIVQERLGNTKLDQVFPEYTPVFRGITA